MLLVLLLRAVPASQLSKTHDVYSIDLLGQGKSWPTRTPCREDGLCYSVDMWTEQVEMNLCDRLCACLFLFTSRTHKYTHTLDIFLVVCCVLCVRQVLAFIDEVIGEPTYVAGNSLGGFIAVNLAANYPRAVRGLALMNATPFWAFRKPAAATNVAPAEKRMGVAGGDYISGTTSSSSATSSSVAESQSVAVRSPAVAAAAEEEEAEEERVSMEGGGDWLGWDGTLPAPAGLFRFGAWYFDRMRDPRTVKSMLGAVYSNPGGYRCRFVG